MSCTDTCAQSTCSRCGRKLTTAGKAKSIRCLRCARLYHKKCFMAETGNLREENGTTSESCVCCLSTPIAEAQAKCRGKANKYATEILEKGFSVVPLRDNEADRSQLVQELAEWGEEAVEYFHALLKTYECEAANGNPVPTLESGYSNFRERCPGRFEIIADFIGSKVIPLVEQSRPVQETLTFLLCNQNTKTDKTLMSSGCFLSLMGSQTQNYHTDGPALSDVVDLFPYAVNVFVPLVAVDGRNGTEFMPGTQAIGKKENVKSVRPCVAVGFALLFDYRVVHRGLRNAKIEPRPCYYATYSQSWYKDTYNFSKSRYTKSLQVNPAYLEHRDTRMAKRKREENL